MTPDEVRELFQVHEGTYFLSGTHLPVLGEILACTIGPILELGMGHNSTPPLHEYSKRTGREVFSFDNHPQWFELHRPKDDYPNHHVELVRSYDEVPIELMTYSVALVDHSPGARRKTDLLRLKNRAFVIIVHDTEPEEEECYAMKEPLDAFRYRLDFTLLRPHTAVVSQFVDVSKWEIKLPASKAA